MPKIVGRDERAVKNVTCRKCASILEYTENEVTRTYYTDYAGGTDDWNYIICPGCTNKVDVK